MKFEIIHGVILSIISLIPIVLYKLGFISAMGFEASLISFVLPFAYLIYVGIKKRQLLEGYLDYGTALKTMLLVCTLPIFIGSFVFTAVYQNDDNIMSELTEISENAGATGYRIGAKAAIMMSDGGTLSDEEIELELERIKAETKETSILGQVENPFTWSNLPLQIIGSFLHFLIMVLIASLIVKRNPKP